MDETLYHLVPVGGIAFLSIGWSSLKRGFKSLQGAGAMGTTMKSYAYGLHRNN